MNSALPQTLSRWIRGETRTHRAALNTLAAVLDNGARLIVGFVVNPLLVAGLGSQLFGIWQVLRQFAGYASPASGRPTQALKWTIAKEQTSRDFEAKRRYVGSTLVLWLLFLPLLATAGGLLAWFGPTLLDLSPEISPSARWAGALLAVNLILMTLVEIPRAVLAGENLAYKRMGLSAALVGVSGALTVAALKLDLGLVGVAACPAISSALTGALFLRIVRRHVPWFGVARPMRGAVGAFFQLSGWFLAWRLVLLGIRSSDLVVLGALDSVESVTTYTLTRYVPEVLILLVVVVVSGILPGLGGILGAGHVARARALRAEMMVLAWLITTALGTSIVLWNPAFVALWVGPEHFAGSLESLLIVLLTAQFVLIRVDANTIDLTLDLRNKVLVGALSAGVSIGVAALLLQRFESGIAGLCIGLMTGRAILSLAYPQMVGRRLGISLPRQLLACARPGALTLLLFLAAQWLQGSVAAAGWLDLAFGIATTTAGVALLALAVGLSRAQQRRIWKRVRG